MIEEILAILEAYKFEPIPNEEPQLLFEQVTNDLICIVDLQPYSLHLIKITDVSSKTLKQGALTPAQLTALLISNIINTIN